MRYIFILSLLLILCGFSQLLADENSQASETVASVETEADETESVDTVYVQTEPPEPIVEKRPPAPGPKAVWVDGYWSWSGSGYFWVKGRWITKPKGHWNSGHWNKTKHGCVWQKGPGSTKPVKHHPKKKGVPGHWKKTRHGRVWIKGHWK